MSDTFNDTLLSNQGGGGEGGRGGGGGGAGIPGGGGGGAIGGGGGIGGGGFGRGDRQNTGRFHGFPSRQSNTQKFPSPPPINPLPRTTPPHTQRLMSSPKNSGSTGIGGSTGGGGVLGSGGVNTFALLPGSKIPLGSGGGQIEGSLGGVYWAGAVRMDDRSPTVPSLSLPLANSNKTITHPFGLGIGTGTGTGAHGGGGIWGSAILSGSSSVVNQPRWSGSMNNIGFGMGVGGTAGAGGMGSGGYVGATAASPTPVHAMPSFDVTMGAGYARSGSFHSGMNMSSSSFFQFYVKRDTVVSTRALKAFFHFDARRRVDIVFLTFLCAAFLLLGIYICIALEIPLHPATLCVPLTIHVLHGLGFGLYAFTNRSLVSSYEWIQQFVSVICDSLFMVSFSFISPDTISLISPYCRSCISFMIQTWRSFLLG